MADIMKRPFRSKDGEFCDCYGEKCMAYYEIPGIGFTDNKPKAIPMCREIMAKYQTSAEYTVQPPYQNFPY